MKSFSSHIRCVNSGEQRVSVFRNVPCSVNRSELYYSDLCSVLLFYNLTVWFHPAASAVMTIWLNTTPATERKRRNRTVQNVQKCTYLQFSFSSALHYLLLYSNVFPFIALPGLCLTLQAHRSNLLCVSESLALHKYMFSIVIVFCIFFFTKLSRIKLKWLQSKTEKNGLLQEIDLD